MKTYADFISSKKDVTPIMEDTTRERYLNGELFRVGDIVVDRDTETIHEIVNLGTNYVSVVDAGGNTSKKWITSLVEANSLADDFNEIRRKRSSSNQIAFLGYKTKNFTEEHYNSFMPMIKKHRNEDKFAMLNLVRSTDELLGEMKNISLDNYNRVQGLFEQTERLLNKFNSISGHSYRKDLMESILYLELTEELKFSRGDKEHAAKVIANTFNVEMKDRPQDTIDAALKQVISTPKTNKHSTYHKIASRLFDYAKEMGIQFNHDRIKELQK